MAHPIILSQTAMKWTIIQVAGGFIVLVGLLAVVAIAVFVIGILGLPVVALVSAVEFCRALYSRVMGGSHHG